MPDTVLDVGCGKGITLVPFGITPDDYVMGVDVSPERVSVANSIFPDRQYFVSRGEKLDLFVTPQFTRGDLEHGYALHGYSKSSGRDVPRPLAGRKSQSHPAPAQLHIE